MDDRDAAQLELLVIFQYVMTAMLVLGGLMTIAQIVLGLSIFQSNSTVFESMREDFGEGAPTMSSGLLGWIMLLVPGLMLLVFWGLAVATFLCARCLQTRTAHAFCLVIAAIECTFFPIGTALGIFTIVVLMRESVKSEFDLELQSF